MPDKYTIDLQRAINKMNTALDSDFDAFCAAAEIHYEDCRGGTEKNVRAKRALMLALRTMIIDPQFGLGETRAAAEEERGAIGSFILDGVFNSMLIDNLAVGKNLFGFCTATVSAVRSRDPTWIISFIRTK